MCVLSSDSSCPVEMLLLRCMMSPMALCNLQRTCLDPPCISKRKTGCSLLLFAFFWTSSGPLLTILSGRFSQTNACAIATSPADSSPFVIKFNCMLPTESHYLPQPLHSSWKRRRVTIWITAAHTSLPIMHFKSATKILNRINWKRKKMSWGCRFLCISV